MKILPVISSKVNQEGQSLLVVLLVLSVVLVVALSTVSRSVTDISISTTEEESLRAFSAAEAGIEDALIENTSGGTYSFDNQSKYTVEFPSAEPSSDQIINPNQFRSGETATFWFVSQDGNGIFQCGSNPCLKASKAEFCWGTDGIAPVPAIEVSLYYDDTQNSLGSQDFSNIKIARKTFESEASRKSVNGFGSSGAGSCSIANSGLKNTTGNLNLDPTGYGIPSTCLNRSGCLLFARVRFFYNDNPQPVGMSVTSIDGSKLPAQGILIESTGQSGESSRKVNVFQSFPEPPEIFDSAVFSLHSLTKNN